MFLLLFCPCVNFPFGTIAPPGPTHLSPLVRFMGELKTQWKPYQVLSILPSFSFYFACASTFHLGLLHLLALPIYLPLIVHNLQNGSSEAASPTKCWMLLQPSRWVSLENRDYCRALERNISVEFLGKIFPHLQINGNLKVWTAVTLQIRGLDFGEATETYSSQFGAATSQG